MDILVHLGLQKLEGRVWYFVSSDLNRMVLNYVCSMIPYQMFEGKTIYYGWSIICQMFEGKTIYYRWSMIPCQMFEGKTIYYVWSIIYHVRCLSERPFIIGGASYHVMFEDHLLCVEHHIPCQMFEGKTIYYGWSIIYHVRCLKERPFIIGGASYHVRCLRERPFIMCVA